MKLVKTMWLTRYIRLMEFTYYQGLEFIGHEFRKPLIEMEYGIIAKPSTLVNTNSNAILDRVNQNLGNLVRTCNIKQTYIEEDDPWSGILSADAF